MIKLSKNLLKLNQSKAKKFSAFTLAEILISVSIIGIVAILTMPRIVEHFQEILWTAQVRKFYNEVDGVIQRYMADEKLSNMYDGSLMTTKTLADDDGGQSSYSSERRRQIMLTEQIYRESARKWANKYFDVVQDCGNSIGECQPYALRAKFIPTQCNSHSKAYPFIPRSRRLALQNAGASGINSNAAQNYGKCTYVFVTATGVAVCMDTIPSANFNNNGRQNDAMGAIDSRAVIHFQFDINGPKKPNIIGRDYFTMQIFADGSIHDMTYEGQVYAHYSGTPNGAGAARHGRTSNLDWGCNEGDGDSTAAGHLGKLIANGWKMDYSNCIITYDDQSFLTYISEENRKCDWVQQAIDANILDD